MNFNDLKISTRLTLGFGLMGLLIGIMGTLSMGLAHRADNAFHSIIDDRFPKVLNLHVAKEDVTAVELALTQMLLDTRPENLLRHQALVNSTRQEITQLLDTLGQQITSPEGKAALAETQRARSDYAAQLQRYSELANAGQMDEARTILTVAMAAPRATYFDALDKLIAYQESLAKNAQAEAVAAVSTMNVFVLSLTGLALIAGAVIGLRIVRSTTEPLRRAVDAARAVAAGDLSLPITYRGTNETAQLLKALLEMQQSLVHLVGRCGTTVKASPTRRPKLPRATTTCRPAPNNRPARYRKPPRPWNSSTPPCATTPTTHSGPTPWHAAPAKWPHRAAAWWPKWSTP